MIKRNLEFILTSSSIFLNFFFITFVMVVLSLFGHLKLAAEVALTTSFTFFLCQIFSANTRALIFKQLYKKNIQNILQFRFFISLIIFIISVFLINLFKFENKYLLILISIIICTQWILEIILTSKEVNTNYSLLYYLLSINIIYSLFFIFLVFINRTELLSILFFFIFFTYIVIFNKDLKKIRFNSKNFYLAIKYFLKSIINLEMVSSFSIHFSNLIWRFSLYFLVGKSVAGLLFGSYAIGSFAGSLYSNIIGPKIHSIKKIKINTNFFLYAFLIAIFIILFVLTIREFSSFENYSNTYLTRTVSIMFSILGSFIMVFSHFIRFSFFYKKKEIKTFKLDIIYSFFISLTIYCVYQLLGEKYLVAAYFIASIFSLLIYSSNFYINK